MKKISEFFYLKIFIFFVIKFSVYSNRHVFIMFTVHVNRLPGYIVQKKTGLHTSCESSAWLFV